MIISINNNAPLSLTIMENDAQKSIAQNIALLLSTKKGTVPMYRDFGLPMEYVGKPQMVAETILAAEIEEAIRTFEPRAEFRDVTIEPDGTYGKSVITVEVEI